MLKKNIKVINPSGVHARPASVLVRTASRYEAEFYIHSHGYRINGKSILGVLTLAAEQGAELELEVDGEDEEEALKAITGLFEDGFGMMEEE
jgi:phosphocarrier protein